MPSQTKTPSKQWDSKIEGQDGIRPRDFKTTRSNPRKTCNFSIPSWVHQEPIACSYPTIVDARSGVRSQQYCSSRVPELATKVGCFVTSSLLVVHIICASSHLPMSTVLLVLRQGENLLVQFKTRLKVLGKCRKLH